MAVAISFNRQRVPMLDASTLEDRTRPVVEPAGWMARRLRQLHLPCWTEHLDVPAVHRTRPVGPRTRIQPRTRIH